jgi:hypothetical protein
MLIKTNAVRVLEQVGIRYELRTYAVDPNNLQRKMVAAKIGFRPEHVTCANGLAKASAPSTPFKAKSTTRFSSS